MNPQQLSLFDPPSQVVKETDIDARAEQLADRFVQQMAGEGLTPADQQQLLMRLQIRNLVDSYLVRLPPGHRWQFVVRLIDAIQKLEQHSEGL